MTTKKKTTKRAVKLPVSKSMLDYLDRNLDQIGVDNDPGIDVPLHARGGAWKWNFEKESFFDRNANRITWVLTLINIVLFVSMVWVNCY